MEKKNYAEVAVDGKLVTIGGSEDEESLRKVADYLNRKIKDLRKSGAYRGLDENKRALLTQINICEDYFKIQSSLSDAQEHISQLQNQIYDLKREIASAQLKKENIEKELSKAQERIRRNKY